MFLKTKHFGEIEINDEGIISFADGIPGFENVKKFVLLSTGEEHSPFRWLQSVDEPQLAFAVVDPFIIRSDYEVSLDDETIQLLQIDNETDVLVYSILVVPEDFSKMTMNLKAPVIINVKKHLGRQIVLNTDKYGVRHYISEEIRGQEVFNNACSDQKKR